MSFSLSRLRSYFRVLTFVLAALLLAQAARAQGDRIFAARSYATPPLAIYEITGCTPPGDAYAQVDHDGWIGPMAVRGDGRLFVVTNANHGSLYDITGGGDFRGMPPCAGNLFDGSGYVLALTFDTNGNAYVGYGDDSPQQEHPIAVIAPDCSVDFLRGPDMEVLTFTNVRSLLAVGGLLYIAVGRPGRVLAYDLTSQETMAFATLFVPGGTNIGGSLALDQRGRLLAFWAGFHSQRWGLIDISAGGDFADTEPAVPTRFRVDVNPMAVDSNNNVYFAGNDSGAVWISLFDGQQWGPMEICAEGLGDTESVVVVPGSTK
jgi:hypothetical protein